MKKILLPVDTVELNEKTYNLARDLALKFDAEIVVLSVVPYSDKHSHPQLSALLDMRDSHFVEYAEEVVEKIAKRLEVDGAKIQNHVLKGNPAQEIVKFSEEHECDMIIMNTHSMHSPKRFFAGSITNNVVHHANVPVIVVS